MKIAIIDLGTNTFHMVILETLGGKDDYHELLRNRIFVSLGQQGISDAYINPEAAERALAAMREFRQLIDQHGVKEIYAIGTSALRNAKNAPELIQRIKQETDIQVEVISGEKEASLIYLGVKEAVKVQQQPALIMDIGGGSVEFIIFDDRQPLWQQSFEIGVQRLSDRFNQDDPMTPQGLEVMLFYLRSQLGPLFEAVKKYNLERLVGSSGAFSTLLAIYAAQENLELDPAATANDLPIESFKQIFQMICFKSHAERLKMPGLTDQRVDMIVISSALIDLIIKETGVRLLTASKYGLKEGMFFDILQNINRA